MRNKNIKTNSTRKKKFGSKKSRDKKIVFGVYIKKNKKEYVCLNNQEILVADIKKNIPLPLKNKTRVKALIKKSRDHSGERAIILNSYGSQESLQDRIDDLIGIAKINPEFAADVTNCAQKFGSRVSLNEIRKRASVIHIPFCTIDGETAKDFDDAVFAQKKDNSIEICVAIADVSHYVQANSPLDIEAHERGTSIYYPGACIPMLPEILSNGLCSLRPNVARLAIVVKFEVGPKGGISKIKILETVIKSRARLTYTEVQNFYDNKLEKKSLSQEIQDSLQDLKQAARRLRQKRKQRGAIDFDITESIVALDDNGEPISIHPSMRLESHKIIEDLMVATNEIVARFFEHKKIPSIYRVHESPDEEKLATFLQTIRALGACKNPVKLKAKSLSSPKQLAHIMKEYDQSKYKETLNTLLLRAMMQAKYSEDNIKHFGLASEAYLHFTSPIRRYADLVVHRQLRNTLFESKTTEKISIQTMSNISESVSTKESLATDLERKIDRLFAAVYMTNRIGDVFDAVITSCTEFGFFVRIIEHHVEGLVHIASISQSHVLFVPEKLCLVDTGTNQFFRIGNQVAVRLMHVNIHKGFIDFEMVQT